MSVIIHHQLTFGIKSIWLPLIQIKLQRYESLLNWAKRKWIFFFEVPKRGRSQDYLKRRNKKFGRWA